MRFIPLEEAEKQLQFVPLSAVKTEQSADAAPLLSPEETITSPDNLVDPEAALLSGVVTPAAPEAPAPGRVRTEWDQQLAVGEEAKKGVGAGYEFLKTVPSSMDMFGKSDIAGQDLREIAAFQAIERGETLPQTEMTGNVRFFAQSNPEVRQQMLADRQGRVTKYAGDISNGLKLFKQFQEDVKKYQGRTPNASDIETATDFANWLSYNVGSGAVQLAPIILAAATTGGPGAAVVGTSLALGETVQNRLEFILEKNKDKSPEAQADAVAKYLRDTNDVTGMVAVASGALDMFGPAFTIIKKQFAKELGKEAVKYGSKKEAAKAALKRTPGEMFEEGLTGGAQEATQIAGEFALGEQTGDVLTKKNITRIFDAIASETAGSLTGSAYNVGAATGRQAVTEYADKKLAELADAEERFKQVLANKDTIGTEFNALVAKFRSEGDTEEDAVRKAGELIATGEDLGPGQPAPGVGKPSVSVPGGEGTSGEPAAGVAATGQPGVGADLDITDVAEGGTDATQPALTTKEAQPTQGSYINPAQAIARREKIATRAQEIIAAAKNEGESVDFGTALRQARIEVDSAEAAQTQQSVVNKVDAATTVAPGVDKTQQEKKETELQGVEAQVDAAFPSSTQADQTTTEPAATNPNTGLQAKGKKRGRPAVALTPEQEVERRKQRTQMAGESRDATRAANKALAVMEKEIDPGEYDLPESAQDAADMLKQERIEALIEAFKIASNPKHRKNAAGKAAQAVLDHPTVTAREREIAKNRYERSAKTARSTVLQDSTNGEYNPAFANFTTATQALQYIIRTGNAFEKLLARRMLPFVRNVRLVVVNDPAVDVPANLQDAYFEARGLYDAVGKTIYLNNHTDEFGQGLNNTVVLHEALHGATMDLITYVQSNLDENGELRKGSNVSQQLLNAYEMMFATMLDAADMHKKLQAAGRSRASIDKLAEIGVFEDIKEFVAYGLTQPELQEFLMQIPSKIPANVKAMKLFGRKNLFNKFVSSIREMFNMGPQYDDAFTSLVIATDQMLQAPDLTAEQMADILDKLLPGAAKKVSKTAQKLANKEILSLKMSSLNKGVIDLLKDVRSFKDGVQVMRALWASGDVKAIKTGLGFFSTTGIVRMFGNQIGNLKVIQNAVNTMASSRLIALREAMAIVPALHRFNKNKSAGQALANVMNMSTLTNVDPTAHTDLATAIQNDAEVKDLDAKLADPKTTAKQAAALKGKRTQRIEQLNLVYERWETLGKSKKGSVGQELFVKLKDAYNAVFQKHMDILEAQIKASPVPGDPADASTPKGKLMASLTKNFQEAKKLSVYFPLMRYGKYWLRVGKGKDGEFYMFESATARNLAAAKRVEELNKGYKPGAKRTLNQLIADGDVEVGDSPDQLRRQVTDSSTMLKELFELIDTQGINDKDALKDQIYQLYLMTLPESDIRKKFTKRVGKTGFSSDFIRNYVVTMHTAANQLSRLEYSNDIRNAIGAAYAELKNNPNSVKLSAVVDEIAQRAVAETKPYTGGLSDYVARMGNQAVFYYMLTSIKSAMVQMTQLPIVGASVLAAEYGTAKAAATMLRYSNLFQKIGSFSRDSKTGEIKVNWGQPNIRDSWYVVNQKDQAKRERLTRAWNKANENDLFMSTLVSDITSRGEVSTESYSSTTRTTLRTVGNVMTGAFHHLERITREIMYMSTFELEYEKAKAQGLSDVAAEARAIDKATSLTQEALFDYTQFNKPRYFKHGLSRLAFQFALFPMYMASFLLRNFYTAIGLTTPGPERTQAATKLLGVLFMTGMFSGATGMPFYSLFVGMAEAIRSMLRPGGDEEDEDYFEKMEARMQYDTDASGDPLGYRSLDLWFRGWFIPHFFGAGSKIAVGLGLTDEQAKTLQRAVEIGPLSALTDVDISGSTSLAEIGDANWALSAPFKMAVYFLDGQENAKDLAGEAALEHMLGPFGSTIQQVSSAYDDIRKGDIQRGLEKLSPAFFRGAFTATRLKKEGAKTASRDQIMPPEDYTTGKLLAQVLGFGNATVNSVQKSNFLSKQIQVKVAAERNTLLANFSTAVDKEDFEGMKKLFPKMMAFNAKNPVPDVIITGETLSEQIKRIQDRKGKNFDGLRLNEFLKKAISSKIFATRVQPEGAQ